MEFPGQKPDRKDQLIETYRLAGSAYADPANWSDGTLLRTPEAEKVKRRWRCADLAQIALQQTENSPAKKLTNED
ncbi:hypothetical protein [Microcoleus sp. B7-D4]|uniref:hypothetical protein n=1 Tax=Microcoleus sp. B7-D4 TaxID=2818696 RepID=UPI002FD7666B